MTAGSELDEYRRELGGLAEGGRAGRRRRGSRRRDRFGGGEAAPRRLRGDGPSHRGRQLPRQSARWDELPLSIHPLLERFVQARLLISRTLGEDRTVEVAHESLFAPWGNLAHGDSRRARKRWHLGAKIGLARRKLGGRREPDEELCEAAGYASPRTPQELGDLPLSGARARVRRGRRAGEEAQREAEERGRRRVLLTGSASPRRRADPGVRGGSLLYRRRSRGGRSAAGHVCGRAGAPRRDLQRAGAGCAELRRVSACPGAREGARHRPRSTGRSQGDRAEVPQSVEGARSAR